MARNDLDAKQVRDEELLGKCPARDNWEWLARTNNAGQTTGYEPDVFNRTKAMTYPNGDQESYRFSHCTVLASSCESLVLRTKPGVRERTPGTP